MADVYSFAERVQDNLTQVAARKHVDLRRILGHARLLDTLVAELSVLDTVWDENGVHDEDAAVGSEGTTVTLKIRTRTQTRTRTGTQTRIQIQKQTRIRIQVRNGLFLRISTRRYLKTLATRNVAMRAPLVRKLRSLTGILGNFKTTLLESETRWALTQ